MPKKIQYKAFFSEIRKWLPWIILLVGGFFAFRKIQQYKNKPAETITIEKKIEVDVPGPIRWRDKLVWRDIDPETTYIDTGSTKIIEVLYKNPWGILRVDKQDTKLKITAFRPTEEDPDEAMLRSYVWRLRIGNTFTIYPTKNPKDPFKLRENKDHFGYKFGMGYSARDKVYMMSGVYFQGIRFKGLKGDIGLSSYVAFPRQDLRLEFILR